MRARARSRGPAPRQKARITSPRPVPCRARRRPSTQPVRPAHPLSVGRRDGRAVSRRVHASHRPKINVPVDAEGRDTQAAAVDQPLLTAGHWVSSGGAVIEQGLAEALGLHVGDTIALGGHTLHVVGIALSTARPFYPPPNARPDMGDARRRHEPRHCERAARIRARTSSWRRTPRCRSRSGPPSEFRRGGQRPRHVKPWPAIGAA